MELNSNQVNRISSFISQADINDSVEVEFRFSTLFKDVWSLDTVATDKPSHFRFTPVISKTIFQRTFALYSTYLLNTTSIVTTEQIYDDGVRHTLETDVWEKKSRTTVFDIFAFNIRVACNTEEKCPPAQGEVILVRRKHRTSMQDELINIDFTRVETEKMGVTRETFELEMEYIGSKHGSRIVLVDEKVGYILKRVEHMLSVLQDSPIVMSVYQKHNVLVEYLGLTRSLSKTGKMVFCGVQPETLHRRHLAILSSGYSVTSKIDGERGHLFVDQRGLCFVVGRNGCIQELGTRSPLSGSVYEVEMLNGIHLFDCLFFKGKDLRAKVDYPLKRRLDLCFEFCKATKAPVGSFFVKTFYFNVIEGIATISKDTSLPSDGLIFTPAETPYPSRSKWSELLKWKAPDTNSIDLLFKEGNLWYTGSSGLVQFTELPFGDVPSDMENIVIEFTFCEGKLKFLRSRPDKTRPNYQDVVMDILASFQDPVLLSDFHNPIESVRKYHNVIKESLIASFESKKVLELACGRGGDIWKWDRTKKVNLWVGVDMDETLLAEAQRRIDSGKPNFKTTLIRADLCTETLHLDTTFDCISVQFALHYFYKSKESWMNFVKLFSYLDSGGVFVCTLFDGHRVLESLKEPNPLLRLTPKFSLDTELNTLLEKEFGNPVTVNLLGDSSVILKDPTEEYLVFSHQFITRMSECGFRLVDTRLFDKTSLPQFDLLTKDQKALSSLNRYYIFVKEEVAPEVTEYSGKLSFECEYPLVKLPCRYYKCNHQGRSCLLPILDLITGRATFKGGDLQGLVDYYSVALYWEGILYKPLAFLESIKILVYQDGCLLGRRIDDTVLVYFENQGIPELQNEVVVTLPVEIVDVSKKLENMLEMTKKMKEITTDLEEITLKTGKVIAEQLSFKDELLSKSFGREKGAWTVPGLLDLAKRSGVEITSKKKQDLIDVLKVNLLS